MTKFVELLINGISLGLIYALIALGFVVIFKATEVINFAHGSLLLLGAYVVARVQQQAGFVVAVVIGLLVTVAAVLLIERLLIRPLRNRAADPFALTILTIGVNVVLLTELTRRIGAHVYGLGAPWGATVLDVADYHVALSRAIAIGVALAILAAFLTAFKFSGWGLATRASAEDAETSALMGIRLGRVSASSWVVAGALAVVAGIFFTSFPAPGITNTTGFSALKAFPAAIVGGLDSTSGALAGGLIIGLTETFASGYEGYISFLGGGIGSVMPWVVMIVVLLIRPSGLFGTREAIRV